ncbi:MULTISPECIES: type II toxin-antitoxin system RelB/DinJ family antitoxin [Enterobacteriaceae]|uniref:type II toxin-antitoxin system RelB/DinJ family antitoxin n=1 Tax=Enterobacteriaceae TaxID=543 RepID=UPI000D587967|nr:MULTISPECIES: type II toxin-antitoxin system RelB/DinJ family antitoxin [Enterobacteriaceae]EKV8810655.1 type II toxin-antitoxin system RelB/DinJ family antitoxin [Klebsiella aerogenes]MBA1555231.1 hypothetical protein [Klebsiella pneumoniae]MBE9458571.1 type II toxin-antitoxin system RelB/DinJ family antitoxin [Enterobacter hormaechei]MBF1967667.1 type II toxin-antitoxin system RelB/DinJ family antitoxin [Enterobacter hormaechei]MBF9187197.1 type II toxin-antitoxin system RelB/DinJ family 
MAQLNTRVKDESKEKAEPILLAAGYTFSSYFSALTDYIAETGSLPFQIRYKPAVVHPEEVFTEALQRFKMVWVRLKHFTESTSPGTGLPDKVVMTAMADIEEAYRFYRANEDLILSGPGQRVGTSAEGYQQFPASLEGINQLYSVLRQAVTNLSSLAVITPEHLDITRQFIAKAADHINALQVFTGNRISSNALNQMIIRDTTEAIECARQALAANASGEGIPMYTFIMWHERFIKLLDSIRAMQRRAGATDVTPALTDLGEQLSRLESCMEDHWLLRQGKLNGGTLAIDAGEIAITATTDCLDRFRLLAGDILEFIAGSTESVCDSDSRGPAD